MTTPSMPNEGDSVTRIDIHPSHIPVLAKLQHVGEHLVAERARLEAELRYVMEQAQRADVHLFAFLQRMYGVDAVHTKVSVDTEAGTITAMTPGSPASAEPTSESEPEPTPEPS